MPYSKQQYPGSDETVDYSVPFSYLSKDHVSVTVDGVVSPFAWTNPHLVSIPEPVGEDAVIEVKRTTPAGALVDFTDGSTLTETDLDTSTLQSIFLAQEAFDRADEALNVDADGTMDAKGRRIKNVAVPVNPTDAAPMAWVEAFTNTARDAALAAKVAAEAARTTAVNKAGEAAASASSAADSAAAAVAAGAGVGDAALTATQKAADAVSSATAAATAKTASEAARDAASGHADDAASAAQAAVNAADTSAGYAGISAQEAGDAADSATAAAGAVSLASGHATTATTKAGEAAASATAAGTAKTAAETARDLAVSAKTAAETARDAASSAATTAGASAGAAAGATAGATAAAGAVAAGAKDGTYQHVSGAAAQTIAGFLNRQTPTAESQGATAAGLNAALANTAGVRLGFNEGPNLASTLSIPSFKTLVMDVGSALYLSGSPKISVAKNGHIVKVGGSGWQLPMGTRILNGDFGPAALQAEGYGNSHGILGASIQNNAAGDYSFPCGVFGYGQLNSSGNTVFALFSRMDQETPGGGVGAELNSFNWSGPPPASGHARPMGTTENVPNCLQVCAGGNFPSYYGIMVDQEGQGVGNPNWGRFQVGMYMSGMSSLFAGIQMDCDANYSPEYNLHLRNTGQGTHNHIFLQTMGTQQGTSAVIRHVNAGGTETFRIRQDGGFYNQNAVISPTGEIGNAWFRLQGDGWLSFHQNFVSNTHGAAGAAQALPSNPTGYLQVIIGGNVKKIPFYEP